MHQVIDVEGVVKTFRYTEGLLTHLTNQLGGNFYWEYEKKNGEARCIHTWGDEGILEYRTEYLPGKTIVINCFGHTTIYEYDERLLITQITHPQGGVTIYRYNALEERVLHTPKETLPSILTTIEEILSPKPTPMEIVNNITMMTKTD